MPCGAGSAAWRAGGAARASARARGNGSGNRLVFMACLSTEISTVDTAGARRGFAAGPKCETSSEETSPSSRDLGRELLRRGDPDEADALLPGDVLGHPVE